MNRLTSLLCSLLLLLLLLLCDVFAATDLVACNDNNAKYRTASASTGILSTVAGSKTLGGGSIEDGIAATSKKLDGMYGIALDKENNLYIAGGAGVAGQKIFKVTASTGVISNMAGTGVEGYSGDGGKATSAMLKNPLGVTLDTNGDVFIVDTYNNRIRKVTVSTGVITTVAGNGLSVYSGDNVAATKTALSFPEDAAVDSSGNIFIADSFNARIRLVTASTGMITTIAGTEVKWTGAPQSATIATKYNLGGPNGITLDASGNIFITDLPYILKITVSTGGISIVAGTGGFGRGKGNFDNILATAAHLFLPTKVAFDKSGNMYITDTYNSRVRKITLSTGIITTMAGNGVELPAPGNPSEGDGGSATLASLALPCGLAVDSAGNIYYSDPPLGVVKKITFTESSPSASATPAPAATPFSPVSPEPTVSSSPASVLTPSTPSSTAPAPSASSTSNAPATPSATAPAPSVSSTSNAPATPSSTAPAPGASSTSKAPATPSATAPAPSASSTSKAPATPSATAPVPSASSTSKAPATPSTTGSQRQRSACTHVAQALHVTMILLSSLLILRLCGDA